ncbi:glycoside hydrolase family 19 protein [Pseudomonas oryzihabitans]|uniref:glycoside hydrolase family 19 protein n=1 Tax=Pseudomonas oryzihabitans TaxID=47885 RepID=UPI002895664F|nr:glycoside hydrolase family 19 protein [Pseudomonas oryzihabitans]MDT3718000.1 glycoside hydrolase family 19 protein [Pseudomonas oryzihabitans]
MQLPVFCKTWRYPFRLKEGREPSCPKEYIEILASAVCEGQSNDTGLRFDVKTGKRLDQSEIRCLTDGEVVAYRINERSSSSPDTAGFVLVRHRLQATEGAGSLSFYSLYLQLADWSYYQNAAAPRPAAFLGEIAYIVQSPNNPRSGLNVRSKPDDKAAIVATLRANTPLTLLPGNGPYRQIARIDATEYHAVRGFVHEGYLQRQFTRPTLNDIQVLDPPIGVTAGETIGHVEKSHAFFHLEVFTYEGAQAFFGVGYDAVRMPSVLSPSSRGWSATIGLELICKAQGAPVTWLNPLGLIDRFTPRDESRITVAFLERILKKNGSWFTGAAGGASFKTNFEKNYPRVFRHDKESFVQIFNQCLNKYGIITPYQQTHFLAQCIHESAHFDTTLEFSSGECYNPGRHRNALCQGNTEAGDGPKYRGRGLIQLTWKKNYRQYSEHRKIDYVADPDKVAADMLTAIDVACWFWEKNKINATVDKNCNDVEAVTRLVNGGKNGLSERYRLFNEIKAQWGLQ